LSIHADYQQTIKKKGTALRLSLLNLLSYGGYIQ